MAVPAAAFGGGAARLAVLAGGGGRATLVSATVLGVGTVIFGGGALLGATALDGTGMRRDIVSHRRPVPVRAVQRLRAHAEENCLLSQSPEKDVPHLLTADCLAQR